MTDYEMVKTLYGWGFDIYAYVGYEWITPDEYRLITGQEYNSKPVAG